MLTDHNVPGLLSSGGAGRDYQTVLEAFTETEIPMPRSGRWANAGMVRGRGVDLAWVIKDASKHFRVPQRRRRVFLVADFTGQRAAEILFVSQSLSGYFAARAGEGEATATNVTGGAGSAVTVLNDQGGNCISIEREELSPTLRSQTHGNLPIICAPTEATAYTMRLREGCAGGGKGPLIQTEQSGTLATGNDQYLFCPCDEPPVHPTTAGTLCASGAGLSRPAGMESETELCVSYCLQGSMIGRKDKNGPQGSGVKEEQAFTLSATDHHAVAHCEVGFGRYQEGAVSPLRTSGGSTGGGSETLITAVDCRNLSEDETSGTLQSKNTGGYSLNYQNPVRVGYAVRRLTPLEAERLMSLPDGWTETGYDGKLMSDSARYQMCGNSIVVNCLAYIMQNIAGHLHGGKGAQQDEIFHGDHHRNPPAGNRG